MRRAPLSIPVELREQKLLIDAPDGMLVKCDLNWTAEALLNMVKNCVEHTLRGGMITISARQNPIYTHQQKSKKRFHRLPSFRIGWESGESVFYIFGQCR